MPSIAAPLARVVRSTPPLVIDELGIDFAFDVTNEESVRWIRRHGAELVTNITNEARTVIRTLVRMGFEEQLPVREIAEMLRSTIGLTERDAIAVMRRQIKMLADGVTSKQAEAAAKKYALKLRNARALTIARTETLRAANAGQMMLWKDAQRKGVLPETIMKEWITADPCPICAALSGEQVPLDAEFSGGTNPPAHPRCRCVMGLVL